MKKLVVFLILSISISLASFAQRHLENNPRVQKMRKEFYEKELQLTDAESKAFWPLFEEYKKEERALRKKYKPVDIATVPDKEAEKELTKSIELEKKRTALKEKYLNKFSEVLPVRKVALIEPTERKFKKSVLKKIRQNRQRRNR